MKRFLVWSPITFTRERPSDAMQVTGLRVSRRTRLRQKPVSGLVATAPLSFSASPILRASRPASMAFKMLLPCEQDRKRLQWQCSRRRGRHASVVAGFFARYNALLKRDVMISRRSLWGRRSVQDEARVRAVLHVMLIIGDNCTVVEVS